MDLRILNSCRIFDKLKTKPLKHLALTILCSFAITAAIGQYSLQRDSGFFNFLPSTARVQNLQPSTKVDYGVIKNIFGNVLDTLSGISIPLEDFQIFGHVVDTLHIPLEDALLGFEMRDSTFSFLHFKNTFQNDFNSEFGPEYQAFFGAESASDGTFAKEDLQS